MPFFADTLLDYFDSGRGPIAGPYGFFDPNGNGVMEPGEPPIGPISLGAVLGGDSGAGADALSLPEGSYVTVGFRNKQIVNGPGNDLFIREMGEAGDRAAVYISADGSNFRFLGVAQDDRTTAFDFARIGFRQPVRAVKIVGLDTRGVSPGFDVVNVQALQAVVRGRMFLTGTSRNDAISGAALADVLSGLGGNDRLLGKAQNDVLFGGPGNDRLFGGPGNDRLFGEGGSDRLVGGNGRDLLSGGDARDFLVGGSGVDTLLGGGGSDFLSGGGEGDRLEGGTGNDRLEGGNGNDRLLGGLGNDILVGGAGSDLLRGGPGRDTYVLGPGVGSDVIQGFQNGVDRIFLSQGIRFSRLTISREGRNSTRIAFNGDKLATLVGIRPNLITAADFV